MMPQRVCVRVVENNANIGVRRARPTDDSPHAPFQVSVRFWLPNPTTGSKSTTWRFSSWESRGPSFHCQHRVAAEDPEIHPPRQNPWCRIGAGPPRVFPSPMLPRLRPLASQLARPPPPPLAGSFLPSRPRLGTHPMQPSQEQDTENSKTSILEATLRRAENENERRCGAASGRRDAWSMCGGAKR